MNKSTFYVFNPGKISRKENTIYYQQYDEDGHIIRKKVLPIEAIENLYVFGSLDANSSFYNFLGKRKINVHFFDYYEHYTGSFMAKEYLQAGKMLVNQTLHYHENKKRIVIAQKFIDGAIANMIKNLRYYENRGQDLIGLIEKLEIFRDKVFLTQQIDELMGIEGNARQHYYFAFDVIIKKYDMNGRTKQSPQNEVNALVSFGNMLCYTLCLDQIYHTQLNPTISFLHEPGVRRFSLALDIAEIFKPILVDKLVFSLLNKGTLKANHFDKHENLCLLKDNGKKIFLKEWEDKLKTTIKHRKLNRNVSYKRLVRLECYKLSKHLLGIEEYEPFKMWW
ncbi:MAG: type I-B CRISPR-associated endonuclease Cas1 [Candidatus Gracilibacteria bacterium]|nr:type I-B CRISPR-associated endonuclease Cas1 [Candidatus Gracilibacteria bacterium]